MLDFIHNWLHNRNTLFGATRSPKWSEVRNAFLKANPTCAVCNKKGTILKPLNIHHCQPFHIDPSKELDESNLITLCRIDHLLFGHLNNWSSSNDTVREDALIWKNKILNRK